MVYYTLYFDSCLYFVDTLYYGINCESYIYFMTLDGNVEKHRCRVRGGIARSEIYVSLLVNRRFAICQAHVDGFGGCWETVSHQMPGRWLSHRIDRLGERWVLICPPIFHIYNLSFEKCIHISVIHWAIEVESVNSRRTGLNSFGIPIAITRQIDRSRCYQTE